MSTMGLRRAWVAAPILAAALAAFWIAWSGMHRADTAPAALATAAFSLPF